MFSSKLLCINRVQQDYFQQLLCDGAYKLYENQSVAKDSSYLDQSLVNSSRISEFFLETIPQLCIVCINSVLFGSTTAFEALMMVKSCLIILNTTFRYGYWSIWRGVPLSKIPLFGRPETKYLSSKVKPDLEMS